MRTIMTPVKLPYSVSSVSACTSVKANIACATGTPYSEIYNPNSIPHRYKYFSGSTGSFSDGRLFLYSNY